MKKFKLNLSEYKVMAPVAVTKKDDQGKEQRIMEDQMVDYPLRNNLNQWLRTCGVFKNGEDIAEAVLLAKVILGHPFDSIELDEREADILKRCMNVHIAFTADGKAGVGGPIHEEAICRVFGMEEVKENG